MWGKTNVVSFAASFISCCRNKTKKNNRRWLWSPKKLHTDMIEHWYSSEEESDLHLCVGTISLDGSWYNNLQQRLETNTKEMTWTSLSVLNFKYMYMHHSVSEILLAVLSLYGGYIISDFSEPSIKCRDSYHSIYLFVPGNDRIKTSWASFFLITET